MDPKISVVIPVYNGAKYVAKTIDSVFAQTYPAHEVIVIDDGSTDGTPDILEKYKGRIITRRIPKSGGPSAPRNAGIGMVTGDHVSFLDADDVWFKHCLERHVDLIRKYPQAKLFSGNFIERDRNHGYKLKRHFQRLGSYHKLNFDAPLKLDPLRTLIEENVIGIPCATVIRKELIDKVGGFDTDVSLTEDYDYFLRCAPFTDIVLMIDVLVYKRTHEANVSRDSLALFIRHTNALIKAIRMNEDSIRKKKWWGFCENMLAGNYYNLGNLSYNAGKIAWAYDYYKLGLAVKKTPANFAVFLLIIFKKTVRYLSGGLVSKENFFRHIHSKKYGARIYHEK